MNAQQVIEERILAQHHVIADRIAKDPGLIRHARSNLARWRERYVDEGLPLWFHEWQAILDAPVEGIVEILTERSDRATWLRSCSPFAGALSPRERWRILKGIDSAQA